MAMALPGWLAAPVQQVIDLVLPPRCPACGVLVDGDDRFCAACFADLLFMGPPQCQACGVPLPHEADAAARCGECLADPPPFERARAPLAYGGPARALVLALKHGRRLHLARMMARAMLVAAGPLPGDAVVVPVPLHPGRLWRRGFNQAALIARALARQRGLVLAVDALVRARPTRSTRGLTRRQRLKVAAGAFQVARREAVRGQCVVLVDDVMTTGATARACAAALMRAGARQVVVLTYARTLRDGDQSSYSGGTAATSAAVNDAAYEREGPVR
jgi:ComF family protein